MRQLTGPVVVGVDGSPISMRALDLAADEAVLRDVTVEHSLDPPAAMLRASSEASLVVVGPEDHDPWRRLLLGSVDATLTHHARCPVAVVHAAG
jgi:nucleotide-binding universal stress UspA family protein